MVVVAGPGDRGPSPRHLRLLLATLSLAAFIVVDAAYMGYDLVWIIVQTTRSFLLRMSSRVDLYTLGHVDLETWSEGPVHYWPAYARKKGKPPLRCRLIRVRAKGQVKPDVRLLTNVLEPGPPVSGDGCQILTLEDGVDEGVFRIYKRTISKMKFSREPHSTLGAPRG